MELRPGRFSACAGRRPITIGIGRLYRSGPQRRQAAKDRLSEQKKRYQSIPLWRDWGYPFRGIMCWDDWRGVVSLASREPFFDSHGCGFDAVGKVKFAEDILEVAFHRALYDS